MTRHELSPSRLDVLQAVRELQSPTGAEVAETTGRDRSTVYKALGELTDGGMVESRPSLTDARKKTYTLRETVKA